MECFCKQEAMAVCTAGSKAEQTNCIFYEKASFENRCMYEVFGEFCDNVKAQQEIRYVEY